MISQTSHQQWQHIELGLFGMLSVCPMFSDERDYPRNKSFVKGGDSK